MPALPKEMVPGMLSTGASSRLPDPVAPRFRAGDAVVARNLNPVGHTRLPRYIKGKRGTIRFDHGVFAFPDTAAHGLGHKAQHVYSVRFGAQELWGESASPRDSVYIDLFDDYLDLDRAATASADEPANAPVRPLRRSPSSRRSARPQRSDAAKKPRKSRRPGVRVQQAAAKSKAADAPARSSRKAVAATRKKPLKKKKSASTKGAKAATQSRRGPLRPSGGKKAGRKARAART